MPHKDHDGASRCCVSEKASAEALRHVSGLPLKSDHTNGGSSNKPTEKLRNTQARREAQKSKKLQRLLNLAVSQCRRCMISLCFFYLAYGAS